MSRHPDDREAERALAALPNLGPASARMLVAAGFRSREDLEEAGAPFAFRAVQHRHDGQAPVNLLYALHGALSGRHWLDLSEDERSQLREEAGVQRTGRSTMRGANAGR
jgi:DNA transformation protein